VELEAWKRSRSCPEVAGQPKSTATVGEKCSTIIRLYLTLGVSTGITWIAQMCGASGLQQCGPVESRLSE
jgi:hypothetical protein